MCGIVGYVGRSGAVDILLEGLRRLEYRGYDSSGIAVMENGSVEVVRAEGKLSRLASMLESHPLQGCAGIGHTRWATHGRPNEQNAHPHKSGPVAVVHNGIIENHLQIREELVAQGRVFQSQTDTEIVSHLVDMALSRGLCLFDAVRDAVSQIRGSWALAVLSETEPGTIVAARNQSPLVVGVGESENFVASDVPAILSYTRRVIFLEDADIAKVTASGVTVVNGSGVEVVRPERHIDWSLSSAEKDGFRHFMLKEIFEQPRAVADTLRGRLDVESGRVALEGVPDSAEFWGSVARVFVIACGTSWHAGLVAKFWIEEFSRVPVEVDLASEFRYRNPVIGSRDVVVAISQSGETADTLAAVKLARDAGARIIAICNVLESSIPRHSDWTVYTHAGPEIGVASTKAFVTQLTVLYMLALNMGRALDRISEETVKQRITDLLRLPQVMQVLLHKADHVRNLSKRFRNVRDFLFLGRWVNYPIALEGALKLKEISYIHAEGYPAGEMKHGPIALVDEQVPVMTIVTRNRVYEKSYSNMLEAAARLGTILAVATEGDEMIWEHADEVLTVPQIEETLEPMLTVLPLQLLAYYIADFKGTDVDQPRNLAKSVTVE